MDTRQTRSPGLKEKPIAHSVRTRTKPTAFLCHNSLNKLQVSRLAERLTKEGISVWYDKWHLMPGTPWQEELENIILTTEVALVLIGHNGHGPWQDREIRSLLSEFVRRRVAIIPVLLPGLVEQPDLPVFLKEFTSVDLRQGLRRTGIDRLVWGITGRRHDRMAEVE